MPSEFDRLVADTALSIRIEDLTDDEARSFAKAMAGEVIGCRPDQRRAVVESLARAKDPANKGRRSATYSDDFDGDGENDDDEIQAAAAEGKRRSNADAARLDGVTPREARKRGAEMLSKAMAEMKAEIARTEPAMAEMRARARQDQRRRTREHVRDILAKSLALLNAGKITAHEVATIEARAHRIMDMAAEPSR